MSNTAMGVPTGRAPGRGEGPSKVRQWSDGRRHGKGAPEDKDTPGADLVQRRHEDWRIHNVHWRWLMDSFEGGERYRNAEYGPNRRNLPVRNLQRHKREYPDVQEFPGYYQGPGAFAGAAVGVATQNMLGAMPGMLGADPNATAADDDYELRRSRTPPHEFVAEVIEIHLGKIYEQSISREGPQALRDWWENVNGGGLSIDEWMREHIAPLLLTLGCLDVCFDRPFLPPGVEIISRADEEAWGLHTCVASYILPENMVWWINDPAGNYVECLVREYWSPTLASPDRVGGDDSHDGPVYNPEFPGEQQALCQRFRHWTSGSVTLYSEDGEILEPERPHGYHRVPIVRLVDQVRHRTPMIGKSRYEVIAYYQREYYNRDSELILNDVLQGHPFLSGPEEYCKPEKEVAIGPGYVLPMKKRPGPAGGYDGWEFVSPPKDPAASMRENMAALVDMKDRRACLTKPAGVKGTTGGTVSQSGFSKSIDAEAGSRLLTSLARTLSRVERQLSEFNLSCTLLRPLKPAERKAIRVAYPSRFQLKTAEALLSELAVLVQVLAMEEMPAADAATAGAESTAGGRNTNIGQKTLPIVRDEIPDDQKGGNPSSAGPGMPSLVGRRFAMPTMIAEYLRMISRASFEGSDPNLFNQIDDETKAFFALHVLPGLGVVSDRESMAGDGSEEQIAAEDRSGQSGATMVTGQASIIA